MSDPKPENLNKKENLYKILNKYLDKKISMIRTKL
jgi:hypothetical protein